MSHATEKQALKEAFDGAYRSLNTAQKEAVDTIDGPVMVIAGPGTGKTQILTLRIANILLQTDTAPESILALTFTESGAKAMRTRLHKYIGARAYQVPIYTFHGFADKLIRTYPDAYSRIVGGRPASDIEKIIILEAILDTAGVKKLRPSGDPAYYVKPILRMIGEMKKEYISPDKLALIVSEQLADLATIEKIHVGGAHKGKVRGEYTKLEQVIVKNQELVLVYRQYQAALTEQKLYDFEDMIGETVQALQKNEEMLRDLQEQYQYVLADEHQDVNGAQNKILELLASYHASPNIFVVGDEKQAIYRFQGASLENFMYFEERFIGTKVISLTQNYRSGQTILDAAHSLVAVSGGPLAALRIPLTAAVVSSSTVTTHSFPHTAVEDAWLTQSIGEVIASGVSASEIAVIVRTNKEVETIAGYLRRAGIMATASADGDILVHPLTQAIEALLGVVLTDSSEAALFAVMHGAYWGLTINDIIKIAAARSYDTSLLAILSSAEKLTTLGVENIAAAQNIVAVIETARAHSVTLPPHRVLEYLLKESGFLDYVIAKSPIDGARVVRRLYDEVESLVLHDGLSTLRAVRDMFVIRRAYDVSMNAPYIEINLQSVQVMTAHKSKGLEFSVVYIPHLQDSNWGGGSSRTSFTIPLCTVVLAEVDKMDDEKRLLYVAMTRAKTSLHFSESASNIAGKVLIPSRLVDEIETSTMTAVDTTAFATAFNPVDLFTQTEKPPAVDAALLLAMLTKRGFSATSLNNFIKNPWDYVYRNVLRIPEIQPVHMQFGTAVHATLEYATKIFSDTGSLPSDSAIKQKLESALGNLPLSVTEFVRLLEKGMSIVYPYLTQLQTELVGKTKEELSIKVLLPTGIPELPELLLTGKLDRIDLDTGGQATRVVDYKTGKPKTRNAILGLTQSSDGAYKRQLVFYTLLLKLYDDERYLTNVGTLSFVEPDAKGVIHTETFTITEAEVEALKLEIIEAVKQVVSGHFLQDRELAATSSYAHLITQLIDR